MLKIILQLFRQPTADELRSQQLREAERLHVEHVAAIEMHAALAGAYQARIGRLRRELAAPAVPLRVAK